MYLSKCNSFLLLLFDCISDQSKPDGQAQAHYKQDYYPGLANAERVMQHLAICKLCREYNVLYFVSLINFNLIFFPFPGFQVLLAWKTLLLFSNTTQGIWRASSVVGETGSTWRTGPVLISLMRPLHRIPQSPFLCARLFESSSNERCYKKNYFLKILLLIHKMEQN